MTNLNLLKSKMALAGFTDFTTDLMNLLGISWGSASSKINQKSDFTQKEIGILTTKLDLTGEDVKTIFANGADTVESR